MLVMVQGRDGQGLRVRSATPLEQLMARLRGYGLDRALARGATPEASPGLAVRAQLLEDPQMRLNLASGLAHALNQVFGPGLPRRSAQVPVNRGAVRRAAPSLYILIDELTRPGPLGVQGLAMVEVLLTDGYGPLYRPSYFAELDDYLKQTIESLHS